MTEPISHRRYVSYIDKSREYYAAHGYERPYRWPRYDDVPFTRLDKPLSQCRIGVVTTADQAPGPAPRATKLFTAPNSAGGGLFTEKSWDREATHTDDPETYLPLAAPGRACRGRPPGLAQPALLRRADRLQPATDDRAGRAADRSAGCARTASTSPCSSRFDPSATRP